MVQWVNHFWNNIFVNLPLLPLSCEISEALHLPQLGLMADWPALAGRQAGRQTIILKFSKLAVG